MMSDFAGITIESLRKEIRARLEKVRQGLSMAKNPEFRAHFEKVIAAFERALAALDEGRVAESFEALFADRGIKEPTPPKRIFLQWDEGSEFVWTWAAERINDEDVEYVLAPKRPHKHACVDDPGHLRSLCRTRGYCVCECGAHLSWDSPNIQAGWRQMKEAAFSLQDLREHYE